MRPLRLLAALAASRIVIVPGFLGVSAGGTITSLGRGGSDLTAVLLAIAVRADACELVKDVPGYFTADPHRDAAARQIHDLPIDDALRMADAGCDLVQRAALAAAAQAGPAPGRPQHERRGARYPRIIDPIKETVEKTGASTMEFATKTIHAGQPSEPETGSLIAPIFQTSTYEQDEPGVNRGFDYSRTNNPTRARLEAVLAELEGVQVLRHLRLRSRRGERGAPGAT